jgi:hypothetical protein
MRDDAARFKIIRHGFAQSSGKGGVKSSAPNGLLTQSGGDGDL